jgi:hypothetical protein
MAATDGAAVLAVVVIFGLIWLRTKVQYRQRGIVLTLTRTGWLYFGAAAALMALGWVVAPQLVPLLSSAGHRPLPVMPTVLRVGWFLATYYVFIGVHQLVKARGAAVFAPAGGSEPQS